MPSEIFFIKKKYNMKDWFRKLKKKAWTDLIIAIPQNMQSPATVSLISFCICFSSSWKSIKHEALFSKQLKCSKRRNFLNYQLHSLFIFFGDQFEDVDFSNCFCNILSFSSKLLYFSCSCCKKINLLHLIWNNSSKT